MKTEKWGSKFGEKLKGCVLFCACSFDGVGVDLKPRSVKGTGTKNIASRPAEAVPVAHCNPQVVLHAFASNNSVGIIDTVRKVV